MIKIKCKWKLVQFVQFIRISPTLDSQKKHTINKMHHLDIQSMPAREIFSASSTQNDGQNSNILLTLGSQTAHLHHLINCFHTFSTNLTLSWSEYELICLKSKPSQYRAEKSPPSDKLARLEPWFINQNLVFLRGKLTMNSNRNSTRTNEGTSRERLPFIYDCQQFPRQFAACIANHNRLRVVRKTMLVFLAN